MLPGGGEQRVDVRVGQRLPQVVDGGGAERRHGLQQVADLTGTVSSRCSIAACSELGSARPAPAPSPRASSSA